MATPSVSEITIGDDAWKRKRKGINRVSVITKLGRLFSSGHTKIRLPFRRVVIFVWSLGHVYFGSLIFVWSEIQQQGNIVSSGAVFMLLGNGRNGRKRGEEGEREKRREGRRRGKPRAPDRE